MLDVKELKILNRINCQCEKHKFTLNDLKKLEKLVDAHGFYGNLVKNYSEAECPECHQEVILLLKQKGQTWEIIDTALTKIQNKEENSHSQEFICPICKRACKSQIGLNSHIKTHNI